MAQVKGRPRPTRLTTKNQATIPVAALRKAGLRAGDTIHIEAIGPGRVVITRATDPIQKYAGSLTGGYPKGYLKKLRGEWRW